MTSDALNQEKVVVFHSVACWLQQTETWQYNQVRFLPPSIESHIVCASTGNLDQFNLPNIHSLDESTRLRFFWDKGLQKLRVRRHLGFLVKKVKTHKGEVLHSHFGNRGWKNIEAAKIAKLKHVVTFYGLDVNHLPQKDPRWYRRYKKLFKHIDYVLCEGSHMGKCILELGCPHSKLKIHHLGVTVDKIPFRPRQWNSDEPLRVLIAASFREKKGIPYALEALAQLQHDAPLSVTIIGDASNAARSQKEKQKILAVIDKHKLRSKIRMLGYQTQAKVFEEAYKHHIFLSPSVTASDGDTEGGVPVSIIEMLASGMAVVSTRHCDIPEVIQHGVSGLLADERDIDGLVGHLSWLIDNPGKWEGMLKAGRKHVEAEYDATVQGEKLAGIYRELVAS